MKVLQSGSEVVSVQGESVAMKVNARKTSKLYFMISSSLYTDKPLSILRELCSNCRDSHNEAGKNDVPFTIIAPTLEAPELVVSDAGTGLTYEKACSTVLEFLGSTKDEGEDAEEHIGGWGIGAKSPRAYTSNYTVVLRKGGVQWTVSVFDDEQGYPQHMLLLEEKTDRPDGVDIKVPIKVEDIASWNRTIRKYMAFTNYNVEAYMGMGDVERPPTPDRSYDYGKFKLDVFGKAYNHQRQQATEIKIVYGGMLYEIPTAFGVDDQVKDLMKLFAGNIELRIRVDTANLLRFGLSREHLEADPETVRFVSLALSAIYAEANALQGFEPSSNGTYAHSWENLLIVNSNFRNMSDKYGTCRLQGELFKPSGSVVWYYPGGVTDGGGSSRKTFTLPLIDETPPKIKVVYSHKRMTSYDVDLAAGSSIRIVCPLRFKNREAAEAYVNDGDETGIRSNDPSALQRWKDTLEKLKSHELKYEYAESTWEPTSSVRSSGHKFLTCEDTGQRICVRPGETPPVDYEKPEHAWLGNVFAGKFVRLSAKSRKRKDLEGFFVSLEDFVQSKGAQGQAVNAFTGARELHLLQQIQGAQTQLYRAGKGGRSLPAEPASQCKAMETRLDKLETKLLRAGKYLESSGVTVKDYEEAGFEVTDVGALEALKEVNEFLYIVNKYSDLFKVINFEKLEKQLEAGNQEAKRLVAAMGLEQFV